MTPSPNVKVVERYLNEVCMDGRLDVVPELYARTYRNHTNPPGLPDGPEGVQALIGAFRAAFPDVAVKVQHIVAEGDKVVWHVESSGTHRGPLLGLPATGKRATWRAIAVDRFADGKIQERWEVFDLHGLLTQLQAK